MLHSKQWHAKGIYNLVYISHIFNSKCPSAPCFLWCVADSGVTERTIWVGFGSCCVFIFIHFVDISSKQCYRMIVSLKISFLGRCWVIWFLFFLTFHAAWGEMIIWGKTVTLFLVYNLCLALWGGRLVWHHQQPGLLPVWRRRLLPVHALHQKGTQTEPSNAAAPVCHIYTGRDWLIFITTSVFILITQIFWGGGWFF